MHLELEEIEFLENCYSLGFKAYQDGESLSSYVVEFKSRSGFIMQRGRGKRWELRLVDKTSGPGLTAFVVGFKVAGAAVRGIEKTHGVDLSRPPAPGVPTEYQITTQFSRSIDEGFVGVGPKVQIVDPVTGKKVKVYPTTNSVEGITRTFTRVRWDGNKWVVVQHFPSTAGWNNTTKLFDPANPADFNFNLPN